jgi:16S rRNA processing protein RimM
MSSTGDSTGPDTSSGPRFLLLGEILRPHGVRGEVRVRILTDYPERIPSLGHIYLSDNPEADHATACAIEHLRMHQGYGLLKLKGVDNRNQADTLRQLYVMIPLEAAVPLEEGEFYLYQLIGLSVQTHQGDYLGKIREVLETGANDVYIIDSPSFGEILIPVTDETIVRTDIAAGLLIVNLPEGLLPSD